MLGRGLGAGSGRPPRPYRVPISMAPYIGPHDHNVFKGLISEPNITAAGAVDREFEI